MNRRLPCRNAFARLALLAALLLAVVPTLGRLLTPASVADMAPAAHAMHDMAGMRHAMAEDGALAHRPSAPAPPHQHDVDCPYCPLLATVLSTPFHMLVLAAPALPAHETPRFRDPHVSALLLGNLGSRGPPPAT